MNWRWIRDRRRWILWFWASVFHVRRVADFLSFSNFSKKLCLELGCLLLAALTANFVDQAPPIVWLVGAIVALGLLAKDAWEIIGLVQRRRRLVRDYDIVESPLTLGPLDLGPERLLLHLPIGGPPVIHRGNPSLVLHPGECAAVLDLGLGLSLSGRDIPIALRKKPYCLPEDSEEWGHLAMLQPYARAQTKLERSIMGRGDGSSGPSILFNSAKVRLCADPSERPVCICKTTYFHGLCTNEIAQTVIIHREADHEGATVVWTPASLFISPDGGLIDLGKQRTMSNHVGISTLAFHRQLGFLLQRQSPRNAQASGQLVPTGSGSADWSDVGRCSTLQELVRTAAHRELMEECNWSRGTFLLKTIPLGYARLLHRGGKPEFFALTLLPDAVLDLPIVRGKELLFTEGFQFFGPEGGGVPSSLEELVACLRTIIDQPDASFVLRLNCLAIIDWLTRSPDADTIRRQIDSPVRTL